MSYPLIPVANALTAELNAHVYSPAFTSERSYADWEIPLENITALRGDVVPGEDIEVDLNTQGSVLYVVPMLIILRQKFEGADVEQLEDLNCARVKVASVDPLVALVQEINLRLTGQRLANYEDAAWHSSRIVTPCSGKQLRDNLQFTGIIRVNYAVPQDLP